ncbi:hypothetical protein [Filobacillus milosensis]|nr:hypothetical protein [Filobacillus milosensis]
MFKISDIFSTSSNKDCCSVIIETFDEQNEKTNENESCCDGAEESCC